MRICCVGSNYTPSLGRVITQIVSRLKENHEVIVVTANSDLDNNIIGSEEEINNVKSIRLRGIKFSFSKQILFGLFHALDKMNADVFFLDGFGHLETTIASWYCKKNHIPSLLRADWNGGEIISPGFKGIYDRYIKFPTLKSVSKITVYCEEFKTKMENYGINSDKIIVLPNGVNYNVFSKKRKTEYLREKFGISEKTKIILCVATKLVRFKNLELAIKAVGKLKDVALVIVTSDSSGEYYDYLISLIKKYSIENRVYFHPKADHEKEMPLIYSSSDIFALPSKPDEGMNNAVMEAMASGKPIVVSILPVTSNLVEKSKGGFVSKSDKAFIQNIKKLVENESLAKKMGKNGKKYIERYSWDKIVSEMENIMLSLISDCKLRNKGAEKS